MARLFTSGFEENNLTATMWSALVGTGLTLSTTGPHSGTYLGVTDSASGNRGVNRTLATNLTSGSVFSRFYLSVDDPTPSADCRIHYVRNNAVVDLVVIELLTTGALRLTNSITTTTVTTSNTLSANTWYRLELRYLIDGTAGELELRWYLGDATTPIETISITAEDTLTTNVAIFYFGKLTGPVVELRYDDIAINDASGTFQNSWPGPGKTAMLVPNGEGATIQWTPLSGTDNALMVDDLPGAPDDATSYNATSTAGNIDRLTLTNMPAEVPSDATIILADVYGRFGGDATTGSPRARLKLWDEGGTPTDGPDINDVDFNGWPGILSTAEHLVVDTAGKTKANLDSFEVGYEDVTDTAVEQRVTAVWVNVEWLEAVAATVMPPSPLIVSFARARAASW